MHVILIHLKLYRTCKHHSTEIALLKVTNDILFALDKGDISFLTMIDLSAAFDTVDHTTLIYSLWYRTASEACREGLQSLSAFYLWKTIWAALVWTLSFAILKFIRMLIYGTMWCAGPPYREWFYYSLG